MKTHLSAPIMRRVYYSYALSLIENDSFWQGLVFGAAIALFGRLTHVAAIWNNLLAVPVGEIPRYTIETFSKALYGGEILTVLVTLLILILTGVFSNQLYRLWTTSVRLA